MGHKKLNSMRFLERNNINYVVHEFDDSIHSADGVALVLGIDLHRVYKTLVVMPDDKNARDKPMLVLLSADRELDLKALAQATGMKKVRMAGHVEAESLTGLKVGGISPLMLTGKNWPVFIDAQATDLDWILLSAGQRGTNLQVNVEELLRVLDIQPVDVSREA
jgi:Cys-tRNA(Pro)/Cys-tRNA(Cys) deacylase